MKFTKLIKKAENIYDMLNNGYTQEQWDNRYEVDAYRYHMAKDFIEEVNFLFSAGHINYYRASNRSLEKFTEYMDFIEMKTANLEDQVICYEEQKELDFGEF